MTRELVAGRELDAMIAERVMGWTAVEHEHRGARGEAWFVLSGVVPLAEVRAQVPGYSSDIAAAFLVVEKLSERGFDYLIEGHEERNGADFVAHAQFSQFRQFPRAINIEEDAWKATLPHAICLAALAAIEAASPVDDSSGGR